MMKHDCLGYCVDEAKKSKKHVSLVWARGDRQFRSAYESPRNMREQKKQALYESGQ